nr:hypothetical protein [Tanacetum cinerariifolium]
MAGKTGSDPYSPAPKPTKPARKPKTTAPKAPPRPSVSTHVTSAQPAPTSAPAKPQEKKCKKATKTSDKPTKAKKFKYSVVHKSVATSEAEDVPAIEPQVAAEDADLQKDLEESMKTAYVAPWGLLLPVVIREPESVVPGADEVGQRESEGQVGPDPGAQAEGQTGSDAVDVQFIPSPVVHAGSVCEHMDLDVADVSPQPFTEQLDKGFTTTAYPKVQENLKLTVEEQRRHKFHPRLDSLLHLLNKEPVLGYLKFSAKGTKREVFEMPIPVSLITTDIREASYYQEYLANAVKHRRYMAGKTGSDPYSPAPKPTKPARKPKTTAPKAPPRPSVSTHVTSAQPAPTSAPAKPQEKKRKKATKTSDKPTKSKKFKYSIVHKVRKPRSSLKSVATSEAEDVPAMEPQVAAEDADLQKDFEESMKTAYAVPWGPLLPVVIREPESVKYQLLLEVSGKGKAKVTEEQVAHDLLSLQKPKKKIPVDQYIFQRRNLTTFGSSGHNEPSYAKLERSKSEGIKKVVPGADEVGQGESEGQVGPDLGEQRDGGELGQTWGAPVYAGIIRHPSTSKQSTRPSGALRASGASGSSQVPPPPPPPSSTNQESPSKGSAAPSPLKTAASAEYQAWTTTDIRLMPSISLTPTDLEMDEDMASDEQVQSSDDEDIRSAHIPKLNLRRDWWKPLEEERPATPELAWSILSFDTGDIATFMDWFSKRRGVNELIPQDLEGPAFKIIKVFHPDVIHLQYQMEECHKLLTDIRTHMRILSVVRIEVFSMYGYDYMKKIVLIREDLNEHVIAERDVKHLVIKQRVKDFQLWIESYQTQLNLTIPQWDATSFEYKHDYTVIDSPRAVMFRGKYGVQMMMRFNEIHKYSDGTL